MVDAAQEQFKEMEDLKDEAESEAWVRAQDIEQLEKEKKDLQTENERLKRELDVQKMLVQALKQDIQPCDEEMAATRILIAGLEPSEKKKKKQNTASSD